MAELWVYWTIFVVYMAFLIISGYRAKQKTHTLEDFMVAGRSIGPILLGLSYGATYFSAVMIVGGGASSWRYGFGTIWVTVFNAFIGIFLMYIIFARITRLLSAKFGALTLPEFLGKRYQSGMLQSFTAWTALIIETIYLVSVFMGLSVLFTIIMPDSTSLDSYYLAVIITAVVSIVYINIGGSHGAIYTDVFESMLMLVSVIVLFCFGLWGDNGAGGFGGVIDTISGIDPKLTIFPGLGGLALIGTCLSTSFGPWGNPAMHSRYFTAKNKRALRWGMVISLVWALVVGMISWFNGSIGRAIATQTGDITWSDVNNIPKLMYEVLPGWLAALFIAGITAASLTTGEKLILVGTSALARDLYQRKTGADEKKTLKVAKITTVGMVVIAAGLSFKPIASILDLCMFSFDVMCSCFLVPLIFGLYWKKGTPKAAIISGSIGMFTAVFWWIAFSTKCVALNTIFDTTIFPLWGKVGQIGLTEWFTIGSVKFTAGALTPLIPAVLITITLFVCISIGDKKGRPKEEFITELFKFMKAAEADVAVEPKDIQVRPAPLS
jgi:SSS family solute:Na+ symporter